MAVQTLVDAHERESLLASLAELVAARGWQHFVRAPVVMPEAAYFPDPWTPDEAGLWRLSKRLLAYAGLSALDVDIELFATDDHAAADPGGLVQRDRHAGAAAWFAGIRGGVCHFGANLEGIDDPLGLTAALAHECAHAFREHHALVVEDDLVEEQLTDLTTVYLGFGVLNANAAQRHRSWNVGGDVRVSARSSQSLGYLSPQAMCFLLACHSVARGGRSRVVERALETNQAEYYRQACTWLQREVDVHARLGIPDPSTWPPMPDPARILVPIGEPPRHTMPVAAPVEHDVPVRSAARYPERRSVSLGLVGAMVGLVGSLATTPNASWVFLGIGGGLAMGVIAGRRRLWYCSLCSSRLRRDAKTCPVCHARIDREVADRSELLGDDEIVPRGALAAAPYRDHGSGLDFDAHDIDGSGLPSALGVLLISTHGTPIGRHAIERFGQRFDLVLPTGYAAYLETLGPGIDSDLVTLWSPERVAAERSDQSEWIRAHVWHVDDALGAIDPIALVVIGETDDGDRVALHPALPHRTLWLRAEGHRVVDTGDDFDAALDTICGLPPDRVRWFAPEGLRVLEPLAIAGTTALQTLLVRILEFGQVCLQREHEETDPDEAWLVLVCAIGGHVRLQRAPGRPWRVEITCDAPSLDTARRLASALAGATAPA